MIKRHIARRRFRLASPLRDAAQVLRVFMADSRRTGLVKVYASVCLYRCTSLQPHYDYCPSPGDAELPLPGHQVPAHMALVPTVYKGEGVPTGAQV